MRRTTRLERAGVGGASATDGGGTPRSAGALVEQLPHGAEVWGVALQGLGESGIELGWPFVEQLEETSGDAAQVAAALGGAA